MFTHFLDDNVIELNQDLMKIFNNYGYQDISYGNDTCNSVAYQINDKMYFQVFLPNSKVDNLSNENWNTFSIHLQSSLGVIEDDYQLYNFSKNIEDVLGFIESNKELRIPMSLKEFKATRKQVNLKFMQDNYGFGDFGGELVDETEVLNDPQFLVYGKDGHHGCIEIANRPNGKYWMQICNWDGLSDDLDKFEEKLYNEHYLPNICGNLI